MRGEVRESGLTGVTRNHVSPCGSGGSNPPLSANATLRLIAPNLSLIASREPCRPFSARLNREPGESLIGGCLRRHDAALRSRNAPHGGRSVVYCARRSL